MKAAEKQSGFTIVETLIVLAVTGALFLIAFDAINGKQNITEFQQGINNVKSSIQDAISEVNSGDYTDTDNFTCDGASGTLQIQSGADQQGSNTGCIFLGKVLQFGVANTNPQKYIAYTVAGLQNNTGTLASATPDAIAPGNTTNATGDFPNASVTSLLPYGLTAVSMDSVASNGTKTAVGAVGIISTLGSYSDGQLVSGSQQLDLIPVTGSALDTTSQTTVDDINNHLAASTINPGDGVEICFASGTTNQSGLITIGNDDNNLAVTLVIDSGTTCS
jgi:prepilin-type N-terminal cleavage/methylation domain-containing protein